MRRFNSDYGEGAHPRILQALAETNMEQTPGYGEDKYCAEAVRLVKAACGAPDAAVHFVVGGTQANLLVAAAALRPHQAVVAAESGHITTHETGAIEATGHKVLALPGSQGKLEAGAVRALVEEHRASPTREHMPQPAMVYISNPTEYGTLYSRAELEALSAVCRELGLALYMDGARLGYGLAAPGNTLDLPLICGCCDAFTIGGTKVGALFGEAVVMTSRALDRDFRYIMKQRGAMLAKGRLLGVQFKAMFEDGLYGEMAAHAIALAGRLAAALEEKGIPLLMPAASNQVFPVLADGDVARLAERYGFETWERVDEGHTAIRFCTAWSTRAEDVEALVADIMAL